MGESTSQRSNSERMSSLHVIVASILSAVLGAYIRDFPCVNASFQNTSNHFGSPAYTPGKHLSGTFAAHLAMPTPLYDEMVDQPHAWNACRQNQQSPATAVQNSPGLDDGVEQGYCSAMYFEKPGMVLMKLKPFDLESKCRIKLVAKGWR